jgi:hypothetical protein
MHTCLKFNLAQNIVVFQRLAGMDNELPYTGHTLSDGSSPDSGTPRNQHPAVARWHAHLRGLATAIHEISGLALR